MYDLYSIHYYIKKLYIDIYIGSDCNRLKPVKYKPMLLRRIGWVVGSGDILWGGPCLGGAPGHVGDMFGAFWAYQGHVLEPGEVLVGPDGLIGQGRVLVGWCHIWGWFYIEGDFSWNLCSFYLIICLYVCVCIFVILYIKLAF